MLTGCRRPPTGHVAPGWVLVALLGGGCYDLSALRPLLGDAGADAALPDAGAMDLCARAASPCPAAALFCDGFELASADSFPGWAVHLGNYVGGPVDPGTRAIATASPVCRGLEALAARTVGNTQYAILQRAAVVPNPAYLRFYLYQPSSSPALRFETVQLSNASSFGQLSFDVDGAAWTYGSATRLFNVVPSRDRWTCVELMVKRDATQGAISLWVDETLVGSHTSIDTSIPGGALDTASIGTTVGLDVPGAVQIDYDEVVLSAARIGC